MPLCLISTFPSSIVAPGNLSSSILELSEWTIVILLLWAKANEVNKHNMKMRRVVFNNKDFSQI